MLVDPALARPCGWLAVAALALAAVPAAAADLSELSLEELLQVTISSASRAEEALHEAPATVIVLTRAELAERGYTELSQILDDLPGMQVVRPWGATFYRNYWRGYRNAIGDPFLLLVDGMEMNHLYYNTADVLATLPLTAVERVEVVYGPASSVYGANAFMGVVNVISRTLPESDGSELSVLLAGGAAATRIADVTALYRRGTTGLRVAARLGQWDLSTVPNDDVEYTSDRYLTDRRLWGGFLNNRVLAGPFASDVATRAVDLRLSLGEVELGFAAHELESGYGVEYAADRAQPRGLWARPQLGAHLRARHRFGTVRTTTLVRYRTADVDGDSYWVEGLADPLTGGRRVQVTAWQSLNHSVSVQEDIEAPLSQRMLLTAGLAWERKDLQKAYDLASGPALAPDGVDAAAYPYPAPPAEGSLAHNRITTEDIGAYVQGRFQLGPGHRLHLGVRSDDNSAYGGATTVRAGWTLARGLWSARALFGQAFQEPTPRLLYGGWTGSGSDPDLSPERSETVELGLGRATPASSVLLSLWAVENDATILSTEGGARNLGEQQVTGVDLHLQARLHPPGTRGLRLWAFASHLFEAEQTSPGSDGTEVTAPIGDLAEDQLLAGATAQLGERWLVTLRGRWVDERPTVATNPAGRVPGFTTLDAAVTLRDAPVRGMALALHLTNLADESYQHPGVREASAGSTPGRFVDGRWVGSAGYFNSLLPQPGRAAVLSLRLGS